jgi:hypothetical protein
MIAILTVSDFDIACLQEVFLPTFDKFFHNLQEQLPHKSLKYHNSGNSCTIYDQKTMGDASRISSPDSYLRDKGRPLLVSQFDGFVVVNVHLPRHVDTAKTIRAGMETFAQVNDGDRVLICGDFNGFDTDVITVAHTHTHLVKWIGPDGTCCDDVGFIFGTDLIYDSVPDSGIMFRLGSDVLASDHHSVVAWLDHDGFDTDTIVASFEKKSRLRDV